MSANKQPYKKKPKKTLYDKDGIILTKKKNRVDMCDCLELSCPGCHFECEKCGSQKCSIVCRQYRDFTFHEIEKDCAKTGTAITNPIIQSILARYK